MAGLALVEDTLSLFSILSRPDVGRSDHTQCDRPQGIKAGTEGSL